jgi:hypothetical protein
VIFGRFRPNDKLDAIMRIVSRENKIVYFLISAKLQLAVF